jgi:hypothetical protein
MGIQIRCCGIEAKYFLNGFYAIYILGLGSQSALFRPSKRVFAKQNKMSEVINQSPESFGFPFTIYFRI